MFLKNGSDRPAIRPGASTKLTGPPHELIDRSGLYYLGADYTYSSSASYALKTAHSIAVIDPGLRLSMLEASFNYLGLDLKDVRIILVTHRHADHWFAARDLAQKSGATIFAHANEVPFLTQAAELEQYYSVYPTAITEVPILEAVSPLQDEQTIRLGPFEITAIATPGHTTGSVCYQTVVNGNKVLFTGDTVLTLHPNAFSGDYMTRIGPALGGNINDYLASLRKLRELDIDVVLPGHPAYAQDLNPLIGAAKWKSLLGPSIAKLERWLNDFPDESAVFLDADPKPLTDKILYLGTANLTASYIIKTEAGSVCVDPGARGLEEITGIIADLHPGDINLKAVLITTVHPDHMALARELCADTGAELITGPVPPMYNDQMHPDRQLAAGETVQLGGTIFTALDNGAGNMSYLVRSSDRLVLIGGDNIARFALGPSEEYHEGTPVPDLKKESEFYRTLKEQRVQMVLPAHPRYGESPFYFSGEWEARTRGF
jgi:metallo-beta-lactamase class B